MSTDSPQYDYPEAPQSSVPWLWLGTVALLMASAAMTVVIVVVANRPSTTPAIASATPAPKAAKALTMASKVTQTNYDKLKLGMSQSEVEEILGPGRESADHPVGLSKVWENGKTKITVVFGHGVFGDEKLLTKKIEP
jgi:hypothetical protein